MPNYFHPCGRAEETASLPRRTGSSGPHRVLLGRPGLRRAARDSAGPPGTPQDRPELRKLLRTRCVYTAA